MRIGRNQPCPCGSGKKYKKCHGAFGSDRAVHDAAVAKIFAQRQAAERIRRNQQGLGRPILSTQMADKRLVFVNKRIFHSSSWKTVLDFLADYIRVTLGPDWGNAEIKKPPAERHLIVQWYQHYCLYQAKHLVRPGEITDSPMTGIVACYMGLAYCLYLLDHNHELQERLIRRLKDPGNFQGAYYELIVANALIRAGFKLELEDETDGSSKHCEFSAVSSVTGKKYWVEAKMRSVAGLLGRTKADGTPSADPLSHLNRHLTAALTKPASDERLIFIDLNAPFNPAQGDKPDWLPQLRHSLNKYERRHPTQKAYVIITNTPFHRMLDEHAPIMGMPYGIGMPDVNRPGHYRLSEAYLNKRRHIDMFNICDSLEKYLSFPSTFDGSLPSETFQRAPKRIQIGETYCFTDADNLVGTVAQVSVNAADKTAVVMVNTLDGRPCLLREQMTDAAFADYRANPDSYFGKVTAPQRPVKSRYELFEWFMQVYADMPRDKMMEQLTKYRIPDGGYERYNDEELRAIYCEGLVAMMPDPEK